MDFFGDSPDTGPAHWLAGLDEDTCAWCVQLRDADAVARQVPTVAKRLPVPWTVPLGLFRRLAQADR
ncbi:hypothetical protein [Streptomyces acidicola]|uniref:hypothetical protein n=1 Tax=Streptomyces acidicola TaxID=2596892 RepID=UPI0037F2C7D7